MDIQTTIYILYGLLILFIVVFAMTGKWVKFAIQMQIHKKKWGEGNVGLIIPRSMGNNLGMPSFIRLDNNVTQTNEETNIYSREQFTEGTMYGLPYIIADAQDTKTSYGLYAKIKKKLGLDKSPDVKYGFFKEITDKVKNQIKYEEITKQQYYLLKAQSDFDGEPLYEQVKTGIKNDAGQEIIIQTKIPVLHAIKSSVTLDPGLVRKAVVNMALSEAINEFLKKHKILLIVMGISAFAAAVAAFFAYNNQNAISSLCVQQLPYLQTKIVDACTTALNNLTVLKR